MNNQKECDVKFCKVCDKYVPPSHTHTDEESKASMKTKTNIAKLLSFGMIVNAMNNTSDDRGE